MNHLNSAVIPHTPRTYMLDDNRLEKNALILFWKNKNAPVSQDVLSKTLWGKNYRSNLDPSIHNLISKLRKLLEKDEKVWITTIKGEGYQLTL